MGCNAVCPAESQKTFQRNISPPSSESKIKPSKKAALKQVSSIALSAFTLVSCPAYAI
jgi:hypothetical protein